MIVSILEIQSYIGYVILRYICCTAMVFGWIGTHVFVVRATVELMLHFTMRCKLMVRSLLQIEYFSTEHRSWPICFLGFMGNVVSIILVPLAMATHTRAGIHLGVAILTACTIPIVYFCIPESCRWLISVKRVDVAQKIVVVRALQYFQILFG